MNHRARSSHSRLRRARVLCGLALAMGLIGGCGLPTDDDVRVVDADRVPFGLLDAAPASPTSLTPGPLSDSFSAYFIRAGQLVAVAVEREPPIVPDVAVAELIAGPEAEAAARGLRTALVGERLIRSVTVSGGTAVVDLGEDFGALASREQLLGLGQLVMTLTTLRGVGSVDVRVLGKPAEIRVGDGSLEPGPVTRDDYRTLLAPA